MVQRSYQNRFLKAAHVIKELIDLIIDEILQTITEELVATVLLTGQCLENVRAQMRVLVKRIPHYRISRRKLPDYANAGRGSVSGMGSSGLKVSVYDRRN